MKPTGKLTGFCLQCQRALRLMLVPLLASAAPPTEYELKLVYLYNFTKFVNWPDSAFESEESPINICVLGDIQQTDLGSQLNGKQSRNRSITFQHLKEFSSGAKCHVLFLSRAVGKYQLQTIIEKITTPTLVVGETSDFARHQGVIGFVLDDSRRVRIEINLDHARQRQLSIRAQLLEIARTVYQDEERS